MESLNSSSYIIYAICVSKETSQEWKEVIEILLAKYKEDQPKVFIYDIEIPELLPKFRKFKPKYSCFIAKPIEITRKYYESLHHFVRDIDENSLYSSTIFGVLTSPNLETAIKIASLSKPLEISRVLSGTKLNLSPFNVGYIYSEIKKGLNYKKNGSKIEEFLDGPDDPVPVFVDHLNSNEIDLMITSGHASEHDWNPGFSYPAGRFIHEKDTNNLIGVSLQKETIKICSDNPKVYIGAGNCLIGNMKHPNCMALSWMNSAFCGQFIGYTVPSWFGFAGWGILKYFIEMPGLFTLAEAYFANLQILNYYKKLHENNEKFYKGLSFDQDVLIFYGDPKWSAKIAGEDIEQHWPYKMTLESIKPNFWVFSVLCLKDCLWECPIADDKDTIPGRPPFWIFKERMRNKLKVIEGELIITDLFVMMPLKGMSKKGDNHCGLFEEIIEKEESEKNKYVFF